MIDKLTVDDGSSLTELKDINVHVEDFFRNLYTTYFTTMRCEICLQLEFEKFSIALRSG